MQPLGWIASLTRFQLISDYFRWLLANLRQNLQAVKVRLAPGDYVQFSGTADAEAQARPDLILHSFLAALGIILLLSIMLTIAINLLLVLVNLPFAHRLQGHIAKKPHRSVARRWQCQPPPPILSKNCRNLSRSGPYGFGFAGTTEPSRLASTAFSGDDR